MTGLNGDEALAYVRQASATIGKYTCRQQAVVLRALARERGEGWGRGLARAEYNAIVLDALVERYGEK